MSTKRKNRQDYDDEDETSYFKPAKGKHPKHSHNVKGKGMRVINSYVADDLDDEDEYFDEYDSFKYDESDDNTTRFYTTTTR